MHERLSSRITSEAGSLPLALLASILVAGLIGVLFVRVGTGERTVRFDRGHTESIQVADAGINQVLFRLNEGELRNAVGNIPAIGESVSGSRVVDGITYNWTARRESARGWQVRSTAAAEGVDRAISATMEERPLFYPGAFGDKLIALNGTSSKVDSYNSVDCTTPAEKCRWGSTTADNYQKLYGTGSGSIGTNENFLFSGNTTLRPGGGFLFDWEGNPPTSGVTTTNPFGNRCSGNPCTTTNISTVPHKLDYASDQQMNFITSKFAPGGPCHPSSGDPARLKGHWRMGEGLQNNAVFNLESYASSIGAAPGVSLATDPNFTNFYCAESLTILRDVRLAPSVTPQNPVVIFVKDYINAPESGRLIACHGPGSTSWCQKNDVRAVRPHALRLQIFSAGLAASGGATGSNVTLKSQTMFAGVIYAPRSSCGGDSATNGNGGGSNGGGIDIYGAVICGAMDQVGNWDFHYDDALGAAGTGTFTVTFWREDI